MIVVSNCHAVSAAGVRVVGQDTLFLGESGEVLATWPTELVSRVDWPKGVNRESWEERMRAVRATHPRAWAPWPPEEDDDLRQEFASGTSVSRMAKAHERKPGAIRSRLKKLGLIE